MATDNAIKKYLYSIGEVAEMFGVNTSAIRYWEKEFDIIRPHRNKKGNRLFTEEDINNFKIIHYLIKERKMKLEGVKRKLNENKEDIIQTVEIIDRLKKVKEHLLQISDSLD